MFFWTGVFLLALGICVYGLTFILPGPKLQRFMNKTLKRSLSNLEGKVASGEVKEYGEGYEEFYRGAINVMRDQVKGSDQHRFRVRPVPLVRLSIALVLVGLAITIVGGFVFR